MKPVYIKQAYKRSFLNWKKPRNHVFSVAVPLKHGDYARENQSYTKRQVEGLGMGHGILDKSKVYLVKTFFPRDYPASVTNNYFEFSKWAFVGSISGTVTGVMATQSLLTSLGIGSGTALPISATLNWIIKDGLGLLGGVVYTGLVSTRFDAEPKKYRWRASIALQLASLCEMTTTLAPSLFLPLASASNIAKNMAWLAMSGTRAQMNQSMCKRDNLGDVTAKAGSQSTAAGLVGTGIGVLLSAYFPGSIEHAMITFVPLSSLTLYSIYKSNLAICSRSLNIERLERILIKYFEDGKVPSPLEVASDESFILSYASKFENSELILNPSLESHIRNNNSLLTKLYISIQNKGFYINLDEKKRNVSIWFTNSSSSRVILNGLFEASKIRYQIKKGLKAQNALEKHEFLNFVDLLCESGWDFENVQLPDTNVLSIEK